MDCDEIWTEVKSSRHEKASKEKRLNFYFNSVFTNKWTF